MFSSQSSTAWVQYLQAFITLPGGALVYARFYTCFAIHNISDIYFSYCILQALKYCKFYHKTSGIKLTVSITLFWIPYHVDIKENENADKVANQTRERNP